MREENVVRTRRFDNEETGGRKVAINLEIKARERLMERQ